jgi:selenide,water dikinase
VALPAGAPDWMRTLLTDPQTSGGLLVACEPQSESEVLQAFSERGFPEARAIGRLAAGAPRIVVT